MMHNIMFLGAGENTVSKGQYSDLVKLIEQNSINGEGQESNIPAGYTYLGQMIAHDIVPTTNKNNKNREFEVRANLSLDSLYGNRAYRKKYPIIKNGQFLFTDPSNITNDFFKNMDLLRNNEGVLIPDKRNDQNLMISQLHLFWQKLHNVIIKNFIIIADCTQRLTPLEKFDVTRRLVIKMFQQVVIEDYLYNILDSEIYGIYMSLNYDNDEHIHTMFELDKYYNRNKMPVEFTHAVFRFGHSMVRDEYSTHCQNQILLEDMLIKDHSTSIDQKNVVDLRSIFGHNYKMFPCESNSNYGNDISQKAFKIDTTISGSMKNIPDNGSFSIANLNLSADKIASLPSGYQVLKFIQDKHEASSKKLKLDRTSYNLTGFTKTKYEKEHPDFKKIIDYENLPLWIFILLEASSDNKGLGKLGSAIVAESIFIAVKNCRPSIFALEERSNIYQSVESQGSCYLEKAKNVDEVFNGILDENRRLTMLDLINFKEKYED